MNPPSERRFPLLPLAQADAGTSPGARFLRTKGPAPYQPRATPWETRRKDHLSPEGASRPAIRNRLLRLTADSPDLIAVIKQEKRV